MVYDFRDSGMRQKQSNYPVNVAGQAAPPPVNTSYYAGGQTRPGRASWGGFGPSDQSQNTQNYNPQPAYPPQPGGQPQSPYMPMPISPQGQQQNSYFPQVHQYGIPNHQMYASPYRQALQSYNQQQRGILGPPRQPQGGAFAAPPRSHPIPAISGPFRALGSSRVRPEHLAEYNETLERRQEQSLQPGMPPTHSPLSGRQQFRIPNWMPQHRQPNSFNWPTPPTPSQVAGILDRRDSGLDFMPSHLAGQPGWMQAPEMPRRSRPVAAPVQPRRLRRSTSVGPRPYPRPNPPWRPDGTDPIRFL